jgi:hypothetical protein
LQQAAEAIFMLKAIHKNVISEFLQKKLHFSVFVQQVYSSQT